jgi:hypothetical protein
MHSTVPTAEEIAVGTGVICLVCVQSVALGVDSKGRPTKFVVEHRCDEKSFVACRGSGYVPVQNDDRDEARRYAIARRRHLLIEADALREQVRAHLDAGWTFDGIADMWGAGLIALETQAATWRQVAEHGDEWKTLALVMNMLTRERDSGKEAVVEGYRRWLYSAKPRLATKAGRANEEILANLLAGI